MSYERDEYMRRQEMDHDLIRQRRPEFSVATSRQQQIAAAPILSTEKVAAMSGMVDPMQIEVEEPPFRHFVDADYPPERWPWWKSATFIVFAAAVLWAVVWIVIRGGLHLAGWL